MSLEILKCTQYDLLKTKAKIGQMYFITDSRVLYKDNGNNIEQRLKFNAVILHTEFERANSIKPIIGKFYYVEETNSLWLFDTRWVLKIGNSVRYNTYTSEGIYSPIINVDNSITGLYGDKIIDNNGLLNDGSVIVRNSNRTLRAMFKADDTYQNVSIKSYLDDGLLFIPNAHLPYSDLSTSLGALHLTVDRHDNTDKNNSLNLNGCAYYYGDWNNYGNMYLIQKDESNYISPIYTPINEYEIVKFYIDCTKMVDDKIMKTYIIIRPISTSQAMVHLISIYDENSNSVVKNDLGELIYTYNGDLVENISFECTRRIFQDSDNYVSEYIFDNYNQILSIKQRKNINMLEAIIPEIWSDSLENIHIDANKWIKDKVLTASECNSNILNIMRIT